MAELEQASLKSEQLSDKSSSPALPDDLSLDEQSVYQMAVKEGKVSFLSEKWLSFWWGLLRQHTKRPKTTKFRYKLDRNI